MSDIYLQITETPTVVTLSAPVVSGALASTVTVANTVTVALDSNSLSALENVTVTVGAAITGTVTVSNFPASQAVTFSAVSISNLPATQAVSLSSVPTHGVTLASTTVTVSSLPAISGTVTANVFGRVIDGTGNFLQIPIIPYDQDITSASDQYAVPVQISTLNGSVGSSTPLPISGTVTIGSALPAGTNRIGVVTIGAGTVTIGAGTAQIGSVTASISNFPATQAVSLTTLPALVAGTAQIGSVTASISGTVPISISSVTVGNSVTIGSLPALAAGTAQIGSVTASISGTVPISISSVTVGNSVTIGSLPAISGTVTINPSISSSAITSGSFTSLTSATLVPANAARKMATVYNLGAGQLFINAGVTATTLGGGFMVSLYSGDFYECDYTTTTLSAIFATAGTASWVSH